MIEQLIGFETAKLAKEKGFNLLNTLIGSHHYFYKSDGERIKGDTFAKHLLFHAPTQSLLQKWLREQRTPVIVNAHTDFVAWYVDVVQPDLGRKTFEKMNDGKLINSYEDALEIGLQVGLDWGIV